MTGRTLVAGVGNVFLRDDAFGVEVVRLLAGRPVPDGVQISDFGIRGVHLAYDLLDGCDLFVLVDAAPRGEAPGTVTVLEVEVPEPDPPRPARSSTRTAWPRTASSRCSARSAAAPGAACWWRASPPTSAPGWACPSRSRRLCRTRCGRSRRSSRGRGGVAQTDGPEPGKEVLGMMSRLVKAAIIAGVMALVIDSLPDIKRYLEIRDMLGPRAERM